MSITKKYQADKANYKVTFSLPLEIAKEAKQVQLLGVFNDWDAKKAPVLKAGKAEFTTNLELKAGRYEFRYLIDGLRWENDFAADNYVSSPFAGINNSVLILDAIAPAKKAAPKATATKTVAVAKSPVNKPAAKPASAVKPVAKTATTAKPATKPAAKPAVKAVAKPTAKAVAKPAVRAVATKPAAKPTVKK